MKKLLLSAVVLSTMGCTFAGSIALGPKLAKAPGFGGCASTLANDCKVSSSTGALNPKCGKSFPAIEACLNKLNSDGKGDNANLAAALIANGTFVDNGGTISVGEEILGTVDDASDARLKALTNLWNRNLPDKNYPAYRNDKKAGGLAGAQAKAKAAGAAVKAGAGKAAAAAKEAAGKAAAGAKAAASKVAAAVKKAWSAHMQDAVTLEKKALLTEQNGEKAAQQARDNATAQAAKLREQAAQAAQKGADDAKKTVETKPDQTDAVVARLETIQAAAPADGSVKPIIDETLSHIRGDGSDTSSNAGSEEAHSDAGAEPEAVPVE